VYVAVTEPLFVTVPRAALPPVIPFTSHVIDVPGGTHSVAMNVCDCPRVTLAVVGERTFELPHGIVTLADAEREGSATLVAVTLTVGGEGGATGAVYIAESRPVLKTVPRAALPPATPFTVQTTERSGLPEPVTPALNVCAAPVGTLAEFGEMFTTISLLSVTLAEALFEGSAWLVVVTVMLPVEGRICGAV